MKKDYYIDAIMGEWALDKDSTTKEALCYRRKAQVKLHKDYSLPYTDPINYKDYNVHGVVILTETKLVNIRTSAQNYFRGLELTPDSVKDPVK